MLRTRRWGALAACLALSGVHTADAQGSSAWHVQEDNGNLAFWQPSRRRADDNYTQGLRVRIDTDRIPDWASSLARAVLAPGTRGDDIDGFAGHYEFGQEIYTPPFRPPSSHAVMRPYAGWLYGRLAAENPGEHTAQSLSLDVGVLGPPSFAGPVQNAFHAVTGTGPQIGGWAHQLQFEPDFVLRYQDAWLLGDVAIDGRRVITIVPRGALLAGTVHAGADAGADVRVGYNLSHPWEGASRSLLECYLVGGLQGSYVLRNLFLDGDTFRNSAHVGHVPFTSQHDVGVGVRAGRVRIEYLAVTQGREYIGGPVARQYGAITAGFAW